MSIGSFLTQHRRKAIIGGVATLALAALIAGGLSAFAANQNAKDSNKSGASGANGTSEQALMIRSSEESTTTVAPAAPPAAASTPSTTSTLPANAPPLLSIVAPPSTASQATSTGAPSVSTKGSLVPRPSTTPRAPAASSAPATTSASSPTPLPQGVDLYRLIATTTDSSRLAEIGSATGTYTSGGWGNPEYYICHIWDAPHNTNAFVYLKDGTAYNVLVVNGGNEHSFVVGPTGNYAGATYHLVQFLDAHRIWVIDEPTHSFREVPAAQVTLN